MSGNTFVRIFLVFFVLSAIAASFWGWTITQGVRANAEQTDTQMRTLAWASLTYAAANGVFPATVGDLERFGPGPETMTIAPPAGETSWPTSRADALRGAAPADLAASFRAIVVTFGTDPGMPPYLKPDGLPTKIGTSEEVNGWLAAFGNRGKATAASEAKSGS